MPPTHPWAECDGATIQPMGSGLINATWSVRRRDRLVGVLQRLNTSIFVPEVHLDIEAVTGHLAARGLPTPRLVRTRDGELWHHDDTGVYRLLTPIGDETIDALSGPDALERAGSAAALVARFHGAMADFDHDFHSVRPGAHDTPAHMARLDQAVRAYGSHRLHDEVAHLATDILDGWTTWSGATELPRRVIHGDLKISNIRFTDGQAHALIDLDTLAWGTLDIELGDAMRSWCNPAREDATGATFRVDLFGAAMAGYAAGTRALGRGPTEAEWSAIVPGIERICWELAARFAQDALAECYFGFDPAYGGRGEHNLIRARGQAALAASVRAQRDAMIAIVSRVSATAARPG